MRFIATSNQLPLKIFSFQNIPDNYFLLCVYNIGNTKVFPSCPKGWWWEQKVSVVPSVCIPMV